MRSLALGVIAAAAFAAPASAVVPGPNGRISFDRAAPDPRGGLQGNIWSIGSDGSAPALLAGGPVSQSDASWSPDGSRIAYTVEGRTSAEIYVANADGSGAQQITRLRSASFAPSWTPDGQILFVSDYQSKRGLRQRRNGPPPPEWVYIMNADGSGITLLVRTRRGVGGGNCIDPVMAPDSSAIALNCVTFGARAPLNSGIYVTGPAGGAIKRLSPNGGADEFNPGWSPDSKSIAYETGYLFDDTPPRRSNIAIMNADGSGSRTIAATAWYETNPVFSPDGTKIAFTSDRDTKPRTRRRINPGFELYTANVDGSGVTRLTNNRSADIFPDWGVALAGR